MASAHIETGPPLKARVKALLDVALLGKKYLQSESHLSQTKWFDYRFMTPIQATDLFAAEYRKAFQLKARLLYDIREVPFKEGLMRKLPSALMTKANRAKHQREYTSLWTARQCADAIGVPYDFFIDKAIDANMDNGYKRIPRPNQLVAGKTREHVLNYILKTWQEYRELHFPYSKLDQYKNFAYRGRPAQDEHRQWTLDHMGPGGHHRVGIAVFVQQILPEEAIFKKFGAECLEEARDAVAGETPVAASEVRNESLWPACYALPLTFDADSEVCRACYYKENCAKLNEWTIGRLKKQYGCEDPRQAKIRQGNYERKRRQRRTKAALRPI